MTDIGFRRLKTDGPCNRIGNAFEINDAVRVIAKRNMHANWIDCRDATQMLDLARFFSVAISAAPQRIVDRLPMAVSLDSIGSAATE
jgi:hypothetical protein